MTFLLERLKGWFEEVGGAWDRFWFTPREFHTLAIIRILAGTMLFYTHLVWGLELEAFLGRDGWLSNDIARGLHEGGYGWSYLWYIDSPALLWAVHVAALMIFALFTCGLFTRVTSVLAWLITLAYCHRTSGAFFGLDQINAFLAMYLMLSPCGQVYSLDHLLRRRSGQGGQAVKSGSSISANIATRLIQLHLCVVYMFGGIGKMRGEMWWDGSAVWYSVANYEYQSLDMTWLVGYPILISVLTHVTVFWETFYCVLVWPHHTRPLTLILAVCLHAGIGLFLGMITFGVAMLIANTAFVSPQTVKAAVDGARRRLGGKVRRDKVRAAGNT